MLIERRGSWCSLFRPSEPKCAVPIPLTLTGKNSTKVPYGLMPYVGYTFQFLNQKLANVGICIFVINDMSIYFGSLNRCYEHDGCDRVRRETACFRWLWRVDQLQSRPQLRLQLLSTLRTCAGTVRLQAAATSGVAARVAARLGPPPFVVSVRTTLHMSHMFYAQIDCIFCTSSLPIYPPCFVDLHMRVTSLSSVVAVQLIRFLRVSPMPHVLQVSPAAG